MLLPWHLTPKVCYNFAPKNLITRLENNPKTAASWHIQNFFLMALQSMRRSSSASAISWNIKYLVAGHREHKLLYYQKIQQIVKICQNISMFPCSLATHWRKQPGMTLLDLNRLPRITVGTGPCIQGTFRRTRANIGSLYGTTNVTLAGKHTQSKNRQPGCDLRSETLPIPARVFIMKYVHNSQDLFVLHC